jgi:phosphoglucosamine mutase
MTTTRKYFGTDGIRGRVGEHPITPEFMLKLGWAVGRVFGGQKHGKILIGKDTRISGYMFESVLEAGLAAAGEDILLLGPMPTPAIAYLTRVLHAQAGIVISASHNPYYDNGIKFFSAQGKKLPDEIELAIEAQLESKLTIELSEKLGKATRVNDAARRYIEFCKASVNYLDLSSLKIALDCANGATYQIAPAIFKELDAHVQEIFVDPDGLNINENCGATHMDSLQRVVKAEKVDLGIALDGDGDRVLMVDDNGEIVDGDELLLILAKYMHELGTLKGGVVGTLMSNLGMELALKELNIPFARAKVGDRYVLEMLEENQWQVGAESSGHIILLDKTTTGDGIIAALQVLKIMVETGKSLAELKAGMTKFPQVMINVKIKDKNLFANNAQINAAVKEAEQQLAGKGRVLLRASGTEPLVRVMVEGQDSKLVTKLANSLAEIVASVA